MGQRFVSLYSTSNIYCISRSFAYRIRAVIIARNLLVDESSFIVSSKYKTRSKQVALPGIPNYCPSSINTFVIQILYKTHNLPSSMQVTAPDGSDAIQEKACALLLQWHPDTRSTYGQRREWSADLQNHLCERLVAETQELSRCCGSQSRI